MSETQKKILCGVLGYVLLEKLVTWHFIYHTPANRIRGSKRTWFWLSLIDVAGPIAFFVRGIKR